MKIKPKNHVMRSQSRITLFNGMEGLMTMQLWSLTIDEENYIEETLFREPS